MSDASPAPTPKMCHICRLKLGVLQVTDSTGFSLRACATIECLDALVDAMKYAGCTDLRVTAPEGPHYQPWTQKS